MGSATSCHDVECEQTNKAHGIVNSMSCDEHYAEEICRSRSPQLLEKAAGSISGTESRLHFQLPPAAPFGLQLGEATCQTPGGAVSTVLVVQHVTNSSSLAETCDGQPGIRPGDAILEANGRRGTAAEVRDALQQAVASIGRRDISLLVRRRPPTFDVEIRSDASCQQKLGSQDLLRLGVAAIIDKTNAGCVLVTSVRSDGLVPAWNAVHALSQVCAGDVIIEVNGTSGDAAAMCKEMRRDLREGPLKFRIAAKDVSHQKTHHSKDPRLFSVRKLIEPVSFGRPQRRLPVDPRRHADLERWQTDLEFRSQKLRREVELEFESSDFVEADFQQTRSLPAMTTTKLLDLDDGHGSDGSTVCSSGGSSHSGTRKSSIASSGRRRPSDIHYL